MGGAGMTDGWRDPYTGNGFLKSDGLTHKEIAEKLGINEKSSSSQFFRAKSLLAKKLKDYLKF